jgi:predicted ATPase
MIHSEQTRRFILTGMPGSGKTSVINQLEANGYEIIKEAATDIIADAQMSKIKEPWKDPIFIDAIAYCQKERQNEANGILQFYDRSPFCTYALQKYLGFPKSALLVEEIDRCLQKEIYQNKVFFFENLGFIDHTDARQISYEEALIFEKIHLEIYREFGFELNFVPKNSIAERCEFILKNI